MLCVSTADHMKIIVDLSPCYSHSGHDDPQLETGRDDPNR